MMTNTPDDGTLAKLIARRRNVVLVDEDIPGINVPRVFVENEAGAREATQHLIEAGHRNIGYIGGPVGLFSAEERKAGFRRALHEAGIAPREDLIRVGSFSRISPRTRWRTLSPWMTRRPQSSAGAIIS